jgi:hypothetical protein
MSVEAASVCVVFSSVAAALCVSTVNRSSISLVGTKCVQHCPLLWKFDLILTMASNKCSDIRLRLLVFTEFTTEKVRSTTALLTGNDRHDHQSQKIFRVTRHKVRSCTDNYYYIKFLCELDRSVVKWPNCYVKAKAKFSRPNWSHKASKKPTKPNKIFVANRLSKKPNSSYLAVQKASWQPLIFTVYVSGKN